MSYYSGSIKDHFFNPRNVGEISDAEAVGDVGSLDCGAVLRLTLKIDAGSQKIVEAKFKAAGCGYLIASASLMTEALKGLVVGEAAHSHETILGEKVGPLPPDKTHCAMLCCEALDTAIAHYRRATLEEWTGDEALICTCFGVSERSIEHVIRSQSLHTIAEVTRACNAGGGCGSCQPLIEEILEDYWRTLVVNRES